MNFSSKRLMACIVTIAAALGSSISHAGFMGHGVRWSSHSSLESDGEPSDGTVDHDLGVVTVSEGTEYIQPLLAVDISDDQILLTNSSQYTIVFNTNDPFLGWVFSDAHSTIAPIVGVTLLNTSLDSFDSSRLWFDEDRIYVNFARTYFYGEDDFLLLGVQFVPEPNSAILILMAMCGVSLSATRHCQPSP